MKWQPRCPPVSDLVVPVRLDPTGRAGPTRHQARRGRWRTTTYGFHVPVGTDSSRPEQHVLEQSMRLRGTGAVTGWAALRMYGAAFFDGLEPDGVTRIPVPLVSPRQLADTEHSSSRRRAVPAVDTRLVQGVRCVTIEQALVDEIVRRDDRRESVVAIDMACAARLTSLRRMRAVLSGLRGMTRLQVELALALADEGSRSPPESRVRLVWVLDAGLARPLCNQVVYTLGGETIGCPDLLDPASGVVGEYDGADHRDRARHRKDVAREDRFRRAGLEPFTVVAGDSPQVQLERMAAAQQRAALRTGPREWTVTPPPGAWTPREMPLDEELDFREQVGDVWGPPPL